MKIQHLESKRILSGGKFPFYLLHGAEEFLQKELAAELVEFLMKGSDGSDAALRFDCAADKEDAVLNAISQPQMFSTVTVVIVENAQNMALQGGGEKAEKFRNQGAFERFVRLVESPPDDVHVVLLADGELKEKSRKVKGAKFVELLMAAMDEKGCVVEFPRMYDDGVARWLTGRAKVKGLKLTLAQAEMIVMRAGRDLRHLTNEMDKLALFSGGGAVDDEAVEALLTTAEEEVVFKLVEALFEGRKKDVAAVLVDMKRGDVPPLQIIGNMTSNLRMVWQARSLLERGHLRNMPEEYRGGWSAVMREVKKVPEDAAADIAADGPRSLLNKSPFYIFKCVGQAKKLPVRTLERWLLYCTRADQSLKGIQRGAGPDDIIMDRLAADMMREIKSREVPSSRKRR